MEERISYNNLDREGSADTPSDQQRRNQLQFGDRTESCQALKKPSGKAHERGRYHLQLHAQQLVGGVVGARAAFGEELTAATAAVGGRARVEEEEGCSALYGVAQRAQLVAELVQKGGEGEGSSEEDEPEAELDASSSVGGGIDGDAWASSGPGAVRGHVVRSAAPQTSSGLERPGAYALPQFLLCGDAEERAYVQQLVGGFAGGQPSVLEDGAGVTDVDIGAGEG